MLKIKDWRGFEHDAKIGMFVWIKHRKYSKEIINIVVDDFGESLLLQNGEIVPTDCVVITDLTQLTKEV